MKTFDGQSAVLIISVGSPHGRELLLTRRSKKLKAHSGEVALPGGKWELGDESLYATALREANEEVGLDSTLVSYVGELDFNYTLQGATVKPYVVKACERMPLKACDDELESMFWLPLEVLSEDKRIRTDVFYLNGKEYWSPAYRFGSYVIWGLTARLLVNYVNTYCNHALEKAHDAPVIRHR